jgi:hypothetical protein
MNSHSLAGVSHSSRKSGLAAGGGKESRPSGIVFHKSAPARSTGARGGGDPERMGMRLSNGGVAGYPYARQRSA